MSISVTLVVYFSCGEVSGVNSSNRFSNYLSKTGLSPFAILKVNRAGVNALKNLQHLAARACRDEKTTTRTIGLNELGMERMDP